jgi:hypothetical protein
MDKLTEEAVREVEQIHSSWIEFEVAGQGHSLMALCADDIELWRLTRSLCLDGWRFRRSWRSDNGIAALRLPIGVFEVQTSCLLDRNLQNYVFFGRRLDP